MASLWFPLLLLLGVVATAAAGGEELYKPSSGDYKPETKPTDYVGESAKYVVETTKPPVSGYAGGGGGYGGGYSGYGGNDKDCCDRMMAKIRERLTKLEQRIQVLVQWQEEVSRMVDQWIEKIESYISGDYIMACCC